MSLRAFLVTLNWGDIVSKTVMALATAAVPLMFAAQGLKKQETHGDDLAARHDSLLVAFAKTRVHGSPVDTVQNRKIRKLLKVTSRKGARFQAEEPDTVVEKKPGRVRRWWGGVVRVVTKPFRRDST